VRGFDLIPLTHQSLLKYQPALSHRRSRLPDLCINNVQRGTSPRWVGRGRSNAHRVCCKPASAIASISLIATFALLATATYASAQSCSDPARLSFAITGKIVRSEIGFTQGLEFHDQQLYESTGKVGGTTRLNTISLSGQVKTLADLGTSVFGEGLTILNNEIFQLTWQDHKVFVYDMAGNMKREMRNPRDGWGLTNDGTRLIFSDGGDSIYYTDPKTFAIGKTVRLKTRQPGPVLGLNELENVRGKIYGNIFTTRLIVRLDPSSGCIEAVSDLSPLWNAMTPEERTYAEGPDDVLNGIAYDAASDLFYLTGKLWKTIFTGHFMPAGR
jgi:glutamine cyclotransferase